MDSYYGNAGSGRGGGVFVRFPAYELDAACFHRHLGAVLRHSRRLDEHVCLLVDSVRSMQRAGAFHLADLHLICDRSLFAYPAYKPFAERRR
ncbi:hypothetical protein D3C73_1328850 [compost metagenome]